MLILVYTKMAIKGDPPYIQEIIEYNKQPVMYDQKDTRTILEAAFGTYHAKRVHELLKIEKIKLIEISPNDSDTLRWLKENSKGVTIVLPSLIYKGKTTEIFPILPLNISNEKDEIVILYELEKLQEGSI
jgi:hypothetical protein